MKIQRAIPPAAAPISFWCLLNGVAGIMFGSGYKMQLQEEMKEYFGARHVFLVSSGKAALTLILRALKSLSPQRREVLIPAYTCFSVPSAIRKAGLDISLCDINPASLDFDYKRLEEAAGEKTLCVIPNHLFGIPSDLGRIRSICEKECIYIVEDAAQAMGGMHKDGLLGTIGDVGFFSLGRGKNITCGSGGVIVTNSDTIAGAIEKEYVLAESPGFLDAFVNFCSLLFMNIFLNPALYWLPSGLPFLGLGKTVFHEDFPLKKISGLQAGVLKGWRKKLQESNNSRRRNARYFIDHLGLPGGNEAVPYLRLPASVGSGTLRDRIFNVSSERGMGISLMYPTPINEIKEIRGQFEGQSFPGAKMVSKKLLAIPTHPLLAEKDRKRICDFLRESFFSENYSEGIDNASMRFF